MVGGIRSMRMLVAAAALGLMDGPDVLAPARIGYADPERERRFQQERARQSQRRHEQHARERKQRRRASDELRERLLRDRIAKGQDDRPDKYLHAAARRRRAEAALSQHPDTTDSEKEG